MYINNIYKAQLSKLEGFYGRFKSLESSGEKKKRCTNQDGEEELYMH